MNRMEEEVQLERMTEKLDFPKKRRVYIVDGKIKCENCGKWVETQEGSFIGTDSFGKEWWCIGCQLTHGEALAK